MKYLSILLLVCLLVPSGFAQEPHRNQQPRHIQKKMDELEKIKLLEILDAEEETMLRFFSRRKEFMDNIRKLEESKHEKLDNLSNLIEKNAANDELKKQISEIQGIESELGQVRMKYISSLSEILNFQQVAKVLLFERNFREEIKAMILKERKRRN